MLLLYYDSNLEAEALKLWCYTPHGGIPTLSHLFLIIVNLIIEFFQREK